MRRILRFLFVVVPTAALATGVVVAASRDGRSAATAVADGDLQQDLKLASSSSIELAPMGRVQATVSALEAPPSASPAPATKLKRTPRGTRALRSPRPTVNAAPEPEPAASSEDAEVTEVAEATGAASEETAIAPAEGGVALPRPTAVPVSFPGPGGGGMGSGDMGGSAGTGTDGGWGGAGTVIRGGGVDGDHCQIHGGGIRIGRRAPVYGQPRISLGDRVRGAIAAGGSARESRPRSMGERVRAASQARGGSNNGGSSRSSSSIGAKVRAAMGR